MHNRLKADCMVGDREEMADRHRADMLCLV